MVLIDSLRPKGKRASWLTWVGVLVGFAGTALLANPWQSHSTGDPLDTVGMIVLILAALSWSIGSLYSRNAPLPSSSMLGTGMEMLAGGAGLLVLATLTGEWSQFHLTGVSLLSVGGLVYLIIFGSGIGFVAYTWLLRNAPTPLVSTYAYVNPIVALFLGSIIAHETLGALDVIAALVILSGVVLITTAKSSGIKKLSPVPLIPGED
jgi:drug/metabolite transporter (DMT)-like permease